MARALGGPQRARRAARVRATPSAGSPASTSSRASARPRSRRGGSPADTFADADRPADAALERLAMANHRRVGADYSEAIELARAAAAEADARRARRPARAGARARGRRARQARRVRRGPRDRPRRASRSRSPHDLTAVAAELYQRLALVLYDSADYRRAEEALDTALGLCRIDGDAGTEVGVRDLPRLRAARARRVGRAAGELSRELIDAGTAVWVAAGAARRDPRLPGQARLRAADARSPRWRPPSRSATTTCGSTRPRAWPTSRRPRARTTRRPSTSASCSSAGSDSEDHHFAIWGLHWASGFLAGRGDRAGAHVCAEALSRIAVDHRPPLRARRAGARDRRDARCSTATPTPPPSSSRRAVEIHRGLDVPFERAQIELRAGVALAAAGDRETALERLGGAYRTARKLGARPLAAEAATEVAKLGGSVVAAGERRRPA